MRSLYYRTVKRNRIKLLGKVLRCEKLNNGELDGKRFCFIPYNGTWNTRFASDGLTALWGTERFSKALNTEPRNVVMQLEEESNGILAPDGVYRWYFWCESCY